MVASVAWVLLCIVLIAAAVFFGDLFWHYRHVRDLPPKERARYLLDRTRLYHLTTCSQPITPADDVYKCGREFAYAIDHSLRNDRRFEHFWRGCRVANGLPPSITHESVVILHIHGSYNGLAPNMPSLNQLGAGHAGPVSDLTARFTHLQLPVPVVGFKMPTEGLATINFGQEDDCLAIENVFRILTHKAPSAKIVLSGDCLGALRVERWLQWRAQNQPQNHDRLAGLLLIAPLQSMRKMFRPFRNPTANEALYNLTRVVMPNFAQEPRCKEPCALPGLVVIAEDDGLCGLADADDLRRRFSAARHVVIPAGSVDGKKRTIEHGSGYRWPPYRQLVLEFLSSLSPEFLSAPIAKSVDAVKRVVVTALYDIGRGEAALGDGRAFEQYVEWFKRTLLLDAPMVVFVDPALAPMVRECRDQVSQPTDIVAEPLNRCPMYHWLPKIAEILKSNDFNKLAPNDLAMRMPEYLVVIYSKFGWLQRAMERHPAAETVAWVDAGQSRFWPGDFQPSKYPWPHPSWAAEIQRSQQLWLQGRTELLALTDNMTVTPTYKDQEKVIGSCESALWATVLAANKNVMRSVCDKVLQILETEMIAKNRIDTEQVALQLLWSKVPSLFRFIVPKRMANLWGMRQFPELVDIWQQPARNLDSYSAQIY